MPRYAENTSVSVDRSQAEVNRILQRYGADKFMSGWDREAAYIAFEARGRSLSHGSDATVVAGRRRVTDNALDNRH